MSLNIDLSGRKALITGVSSGIGAGIARVLSEAGCAIAGCGLEPIEHKGASTFVESVEGQGQFAHYTQVDLANGQAARAWVEQASNTLEGIDVVISNAGAAAFHSLSDATDEQWERNINLNLAAHWRVSQAAKPYLEQGNDPLIIIMASNHAYYTIPGCFPYNVAKAGLTAMVQSMAIEWGPTIRTVGIAPGFIDTIGGQEWFDTFPDPAAERKRTEESHPVGRIGSVEEIGGLCAFLASPYGRFISGSTILADGGRAALMQRG